MATDSDTEFNRVCALLVADKGFDTFRAELYKRIGTETLKGDYALEHKAPMQLGALMTVPVLVKLIEECADKIRKPNRPKRTGEY